MAGGKYCAGCHRKHQSTVWYGVGDFTICGTSYKRMFRQGMRVDAAEAMDSASEIPNSIDLSKALTYFLRVEYAGSDASAMEVFEKLKEQGKLKGMDFNWFIGWAFQHRTRDGQYRYCIVRDDAHKISIAMSPPVEAAHAVAVKERTEYGKRPREK